MKQTHRTGTYPADSWGQTPLGHWENDADGLPVFIYEMDQENDARAWYPTSLGMSNDHFHLVGNGRLVAFAYNHGEVVIYTGERGAMWLNRRNLKGKRFAGGYGFLADDGKVISMRFADRPGGSTYERRFGIGYFEKTLTTDDYKITQTVRAAPGEETVLFSTVKVENLGSRARKLIWYEYWDVNPHYFGAMLDIAGEEGKSTGKGEGLGSGMPFVEKLTRMIPGRFIISRLVVRFLTFWRKRFTRDYSVRTVSEGGMLKAIIGPPAGKAKGEGREKVDSHPTEFFLKHISGGNIVGFETRRARLFDWRGRFRPRIENGLVKSTPMNHSKASLVSAVELEINPGESKSIEHLVGYDRGGRKQGPAAEWKEVLSRVSVGDPRIDAEMVWHAYYLGAIATYDDYFRARIMSQSCCYQYVLGLNIAARDPLQHMLPMVYLEPELARDVLIYTISEMDGKGFIPYGIKGVGIRTAAGNPFPSDTNLYLMLSLVEYVTATRDFGFLNEVLPFYPREDGKSGTVMDHMKLAWRHQIEDVGVGPNGLIKLRNSDWNDSFIAEEKSLDKNLDLAQTEAEAESVLNTAMAAYILPRFADLIRAHGEADWANEVQARAEQFREAVRRQWNGRWYHRALLPNGKVVGSKRIYLSLQPWAILGDVPTAEEELILDDNLYHELSSRSPIGAVMRWPPVSIERLEKPGTATNGGIWYSLRFPLIMAYARRRPDYAWEEFIKMTNLTHAEAYPEVWIGQWSGPDSYNAPNSHSPGYTWSFLPFLGGMMDFPVVCGHAHAALWFSLLKLMGVHPDAEGFLIDPKIPVKNFSLQTPLLSLARNEKGLEGSIHPRGDSVILWRVRTGQSPFKVTVNDQPTAWKQTGDDTTFPTQVIRGEPCRWRITYQ